MSVLTSRGISAPGSRLQAPARPHRDGSSLLKFVLASSASSFPHLTRHTPSLERKTLILSTRRYLVALMYVPCLCRLRHLGRLVGACPHAPCPFSEASFITTSLLHPPQRPAASSQQHPSFPSQFLQAWGYPFGMPSCTSSSTLTCPKVSASWNHHERLLKSLGGSLRFENCPPFRQPCLSPWL